MAESADCACELKSHSQFGPVLDGERLVRILTDRHFKNNGEIRTSAFSLTDIISDGVSVVRAKYVSVAEAQAVFDDIRRAAAAERVDGALIASAQAIRLLTWDNGKRKLCVLDDPVLNDPNLRDNPAHAIALSEGPIDREQAQVIRADLLKICRHVGYLSGVFFP